MYFLIFSVTDGKKTMENNDDLRNQYGNTGCRFFKGGRGIQNWKHFSLKINVPKGIVKF